LAGQLRGAPVEPNDSATGRPPRQGSRSGTLAGADPSPARALLPGHGPSPAPVHEAARHAHHAHRLPRRPPDIAITPGRRPRKA
jgi:hypothetical protein